jgi:hypothetical protein
MTAVWRTAGLTATVLALLAGTEGRAADEPKAIVEKAIQAFGGADVLGKHAGKTMKLKGKWYGMGDGLEYTGIWSGRAPDRLRFEITMSIMGQNITFIQGVKGEKGWKSLNGMVSDMDKDELAEHREGLHGHDVQNLVALRGKDYALSSLGESKVGDRTAVGIHVERKGYRDINLFFDKETHLLLKTETRAKDPMAGNQEFTVVARMGDYKKVDGLMVAHKVEIFRDDKLYVDGEVTEHSAVEKFDDTTFDKP